MKAATCCFSGHRRLPAGKIGEITKRLDREIDKLYAHGVTNFISGGAAGFDQIAAALILAKREAGYNVRLIFALPCKNQEAAWGENQREHFYRLLSKADEIVYVSGRYSADCMKKRNQYMIDRSAVCLCALLSEISGTGQTVRYARKNRVKVINVAE